MTGANAPGLVDTHAHLDILAAEGMPATESLARALEAGVERVITIGIDLSSSLEAVRLAERHPGVYATVGVHPHDAEQYDSGIEDELRAMAAHPKVVAIGEAGLDYYRDRSPRDRQRVVFRRQLELAADLGLPVCIHCRDASEDLLRILTEQPRKPDTMILHCFSGDEDLAVRMLDLGCHISLAGPVTFKNAEKTARVAQTLPAERLLIETDCPYLAPHPQRGDRNEPALLPLVAARIAVLRGMTVDDVARVTTANACRVFGLERP